MKVLVTGKNGQVGYLLSQKLALISDVELLAVDKRELNIVDSADVKCKVSEFKPDVIINAAAYTAVDKAEQERELAFDVNCTGVKNLAEAAEECGALLIHISTDYVFPGDKIGNYEEVDLTGPTSVYGQSKLAGENEIKKISSRYFIIRTAWVFGEHGNNFVKTMLRLAETHSKLRIVADQFGGPTYAGDIADTIIHMLNKIPEQHLSNGVYHYTGLPHVNWCEFAQSIFKKAQEQGLIESIPEVSPITTDEYPTPAQRPANSKLDTTRITQDFGVPASNWMKALNSIKAYKS
jgi:dTDP-4-dehydrorhamnose reductase